MELVSKGVHVMLRRITQRLIIGLIMLALAPLSDTAPRVIQAALPENTTTEKSVAAGDNLIVHEWGTFTTIAGEDGLAVKWRPIDDTSDLPGFVYGNDGLARGTGLRHGKHDKASMEALVRMETPIIYFYTDREMDVSLSVNFPSGRITEWYPQARFVNSTIDWGRLTIVPDAKVEFPVERRDSHYYPARETDAAPVRVCGNKSKNKADEYEKFLFYRGVGSFDLPLAVRLDEGRVVVRNNGRDDIAKIIIFDNRDGMLSYSIHDLDAKELTVDRPRARRAIDSLQSDLAGLLVASGLYEKEAKAMIKTWRDSWFEERLRAFYILPRPATDRILPITIEPQPVSLVRVMVGRVEIITPEMEGTILREVARLSDDRAEIRKAAQKAIERRGRFAEPVLKRILEKTEDSSLRARIEQLIKRA